MYMDEAPGTPKTWSESRSSHFDEELGIVVNTNEHLRKLSVPLPKQCWATNKKTGKRCKKAPEKGARVCRQHGGKAPSTMAAAQERMALHKAVETLKKLGQEVQPWERKDPREALLDLVHQSWSLKEALQFLVNDLEEEEVKGIGEMERVTDEMGSTSLIPHSGGAKAQIRIKLLEGAMDRAARLSKSALDAGIEERMVRLAEQQANTVAEVIRIAVQGLPEDMAILVIQRTANELRLRSTLRRETPKLVGASDGS